MSHTASDVPGLAITGIAGYAAHGPIHTGVWNGLDVSVRRTGAGSVPLATRRARLERLTTIDSPHVARVVHVARSEAGLTILSEHVPGPSLSTLRAGSRGLDLRQGWRLLADLCAALAALHERGIIHADVSPSNILVRGERPQRGRVVLVDVGGEEDWELGTVGFRAPEIATGASGSRAGDVWSAARVVVWSVQEDHRLYFHEVLANALQDDPRRRPGARELAQRAEAEAAPQLQLPDEAELASAHLRAKASTQPTTRAGRRRRARPRDPRKKLLGAAVFLTFLLGGYLLAAGVFDAGGEHTRHPGADLPAPADGNSPSLGEAVRTLTELRDRALATHDEDLLARVSLPASKAAQADRELLRSFRGSRPVGLATTVDVLEVSEGGDGPVVTAMLTQAGFTWEGGANDGTSVAPLPARCTRIHLSEVDEEWFVHEVSACAADEISG